MADVLSLEQFEQLAAQETATQEVAPASQKNVLSVSDFENLAAVERAVTDPAAADTRPFEKQVFDVATKGDRTFWENMAESFKRGDQSSNLDMMAYQASLGQLNYDKDVKPIRLAVEAEIAKDPIKGANIFSDALYAVSGMAPAMGKGIATGATAGAALAVGSAALGAPQAAPLAFTAGQVTMSADYWYKQGAGELYSTLKDEEIDDAVAVPVAHIGGAIYGAIEFSQVAKLIPGGKGVLKKGVTYTTKRYVAAMVKKYGVNWVAEVGEEGLQAVVMSVAKDVAMDIAEKADKTAVQMAGKAMSSGWSAVKESALPMLLLMAPGGVVDAKRGIDQAKAIKQADKILKGVTVAELEAMLAAGEVKLVEEEGDAGEAEAEEAKAEAPKSERAESIERDKRYLSVMQERATRLAQEAKDNPGSKEAKTELGRTYGVIRDVKKRIKMAEAEEAKAVKAAPADEQASELTEEQLDEAPDFDAERAADQAGREYEKNQELKEAGKKGKIKKRVKVTAENAAEWLEDHATPMSSQLGRIHPRLKAALVAFEIENTSRVLAAKEAVKPFQKAFKGMPEVDRNAFDLALKNGDQAVVDKFLKKHNAKAAYDAWIQVRDDLAERARQVGFDFDDVEVYFPRVVKDVRGFLAHIRKSPEWTLFDEAIRKKELELGMQPGTMDDDTRAAYINSLLKKAQETDIKLTRPMAMKERTIKRLTAELNQFYYDSNTALGRYVTGMNNAISIRKFFGKAAPGGESAMDNIGGSIGKLVLDLLQAKELSGTEARQLSNILNSRFNEKGPGQFVGFMKNVAYIDVLGNPISAITQLSDIYASLYRNGYYQTLKSAFSKKEISLSDVHIGNISHEFSDTGQSAQAVAKVFKSTGFKMTDSFGKATFVNAAFARLQAQAKDPNADFAQQLETIFGDEAASVADDLAAGRATPNVKMLLAAELFEMQPLALSEMPPAYARAGNGRVFWMMKSYTIKLLDVARKDIIDTFPEDPRKALTNLVRLTTALAVTKAGSEAIKDFILGRDIDLGDAAVEGILQIIGFNKYLTQQIGREGIGRAATESILPPTRLVDSLQKDIAGSIVDGESPMEWESIRSIPGGGELFYWWVGGGRTKINKERAKKYGKRVEL